MNELSKIQIEDLILNIKDGYARNRIEYVETEMSNNIGNVEKEITERINETSGVLLSDFEDYVVDGEYTEVFNKAIQKCVETKQKLLVEKGVYPVSTIEIKNIDGLEIDFLSGSSLVNKDNKQRTFILLENTKNVIVKNASMDGGGVYYRGVAILKNCDNIVFLNTSIKNIGQSDDVEPIEVPCVGVHVSINNVRNVLFDKLNINSVTNIQNQIVGDALGSARGIYIGDFVYENDSVSNIVFNETTIGGVLGEDGDGVQIKGKTPNGSYLDVKFNNLHTYDCERRGVKIQFARGIVIDGLKVNLINENFEMSEGVGLYFGGNTLKNINIDIVSMFGIGFSFAINSAYKTLIENAVIGIGSQQFVNGSACYAINIDGYGSVTASDIVFNNVKTNSFTSGFRFRTFTRNITITNTEVQFYGEVKTAIYIALEIGTATGKDGLNFAHKDIIIDNLTCNGKVIYTTSDTPVDNFYIGTVKGSTNVDIYAELLYAHGVVFRIPKREYSATGVPTKGYYITGDYVRDIRVAKGSNTYRKGWLRVTTGSGHVLGTDWIEDKITI